ncbi:MAG: hypothetical protein A3F35_02330 [Candidatus Woykebacteria bacterium RIFCSPHIGHO2_12_FULL_45_10]|uniref:Uncharacterized protein n=1 Tax=Candidatus Woykebacteria bacterium RIFCSPHIGHO2_12_FULL_45_10 TaxID=1802603 RepID=A0A1G1WR34_9BACT|nr:MAG: hypothetical protein A3F35_02330 [Candidatus Woykebacteria bacterium RIFCSPHIGHO2_12_FULL_45_10]
MTDTLYILGGVVSGGGGGEPDIDVPRSPLQLNGLAPPESSETCTAQLADDACTSAVVADTTIVKLSPESNVPPVWVVLVGPVEPFQPVASAVLIAKLADGLVIFIQTMGLLSVLLI